MGLERFTGGKVGFHSKYAGQACYPCGVPRRIVVGNTGASRLQPISKPRVKFQNHYYQTTDPDIVRGMVEDGSNFARPWGWHIDNSSLPIEVREVFSNLSRASKQKAVLALIDGQAPQVVRSDMDSNEIERGSHEPITDGSSALIREPCPVKGCVVEVSEVGENARATVKKLMSRHIRVAHPQWDKDRGKSFPAAPVESVSEKVEG